MKVLSAFGLMVVLTAACEFTAAADDDNAKKIVGTWEVTGGADLPTGAVAEFTKDEKLTVVGKIDGKVARVEGSYKIEKDRLSIKLAYLGETTDATTQIVKLTDEVMETRDADKKVTTSKRKK